MSYKKRIKKLLKDVPVKPKATELDTLFNNNEQVKAVLNNNWMQDGTPNPFFGKAIPNKRTKK
jgi:hypothetical protein